LNLSNINRVITELGNAVEARRGAGGENERVFTRDEFRDLVKKATGIHRGTHTGKLYGVALVHFGRVKWGNEASGEKSGTIVVVEESSGE